MARLMLVDDEMIVTQTLQAALKPILPECDIFCINSAPDALRLLRLYSFDVVVTDISMPQMDGLELLKEIRKCWPMCYVIVLTAYDSFDYVYQTTKYDNVRFILKLEEINVITDVIRRALERVKEKVDVPVDDEPEEITGSENGVKQQLIERIRTYIAEHLAESLSLTELAETLHYNSSYLSRVYKQMTGEGLNEYINRVRIAHASVLLDKECIDMEKIANESGFQTAKYFSAIFKRTTGISPIAYHRRAMEKKRMNEMDRKLAVPKSAHK